MGDSLFETPIPYFAAGALAGSLVVLASILRTVTVVLLAIVGAALAFAVVIGVEYTDPGGLRNEQRALLIAIVICGVISGALVTAASLAYARWVRGVYRRAERSLR